MTETHRFLLSCKCLITCRQVNKICDEINCWTQWIWYYSNMSLNKLYNFITIIIIKTKLENNCLISYPLENNNIDKCLKWTFLFKSSFYISIGKVYRYE